MTKSGRWPPPNGATTVQPGARSGAEVVLDRMIQQCMTISRLAAWICGGLLLLSSVLVGVEVLSRKIFRVSIPGVDEMTGLVLGVGTAWALSLALLRRQHIRVDILHGMVPPRVALLLDLLATGAFVFLIGLVAWYGWAVLEQSWISSSRGLSSIPLVIPQFLWFAGMAFLVAVGLLLMLRSVVAVIAGDTALAFALIGPRAAVEEAKELLDVKEQVR